MYLYLHQGTFSLQLHVKMVSGILCCLRSSETEAVHFAVHKLSENPFVRQEYRSIGLDISMDVREYSSLPPQLVGEIA
jgi:hypothetical protein